MENRFALIKNPFVCLKNIVRLMLWIIADGCNNPSSFGSFWEDILFVEEVPQMSYIKTVLFILRNLWRLSRSLHATEVADGRRNRRRQTNDVLLGKNKEVGLGIWYVI